jgi:hypothetical protein
MRLSSSANLTHVEDYELSLLLVLLDVHAVVAHGADDALTAFLERQVDASFAVILGPVV